MHKSPLRQRLLFALVAVLISVSACTQTTPAPTAKPTIPATVTSTATRTPSQTPSPLPSETPLPTNTPLPTLTATPTPLPANRLPIIEYHDPDFKMNDQVQMASAWFEDQMSWLSQNGYTTLTGEEFADYLDGSVTFPQRSIMLTFDVGTARRQIYTEVVIPTLRKYKFKATFFILANETVENDPCKPEDNKHFCWDDFRSWADEGLITVASHGLYHPDFTTLTAAQIKYEVETPLKLLEEKVGRTPIAFAYPFDSISNTAVNIVKAAGYRFAVAGNSRKDLAIAPQDVDRYKLPRMYPYSNTHIYPNLTGYNRPFGDVITDMSKLGPTATPAKPTAGTPAAATATPGTTVTPGTVTPAATATGAALSNVEKMTQFCKTLPSDMASRVAQLMKTTFDSDLSSAAREKLPGFSVSPSCNIFQNNKPEAIVLHYTVGELNASLYNFRQSNTSAHYVIDRDGKVVQVVPEGLGAMHASCTGSRVVCVASCPICDGQNGQLTEPYLRSVGIEIVNRGHVPEGTNVAGGMYEDYLRSFAYPYWEDYTDAQVESLRILVNDIAERWNIPIDPQHVIGHYRVNQKVDPGPALNLFWQRTGNPSRPPIFALPGGMP